MRSDDNYRHCFCRRYVFTYIKARVKPNKKFSRKELDYKNLK